MSDIQVENVAVVDNAPTPVVSGSAVTIAGQEYQITPLNAKKVARIANLFATLVIGGNKKIKELKAPDTTNLLLGVLAAVDENTLITLAAVLVDCDPQFAHDNFDLLWVTDALAKQIAISNLRAVVENFTSLLSQIQ